MHWRVYLDELKQYYSEVERTKNHCEMIDITDAIFISNKPEKDVVYKITTDKGYLKYKRYKNYDNGNYDWLIDREIYYKELDEMKQDFYINDIYATPIVTGVIEITSRTNGNLNDFIYTLSRDILSKEYYVPLAYKNAVSWNISSFKDVCIRISNINSFITYNNMREHYGQQKIFIPYNRSINRNGTLIVMITSSYTEYCPEYISSLQDIAESYLRKYLSKYVYDINIKWSTKETMSRLKKAKPHLPFNIINHSDSQINKILQEEV